NVRSRSGVETECTQSVFTQISIGRSPRTADRGPRIAHSEPQGGRMKSRTLKSIMMAAVLAIATGLTPVHPAAAPAVETGLSPTSIGVLTFAPDGVLFAADPEAATIYALYLGDQAAGGKAGAGDVGSIDQKMASVLGTDAASVLVRDLAVHPKTKN